ncbi:MAG: D-alanyl-D-alanine carboxypeptidase, partial [Pseudomonadota bacterium]
LDAYAGGDGIKTGYTRAAGFNLVASAQRGQERIIATVFGGSSTAARNARITELMDLGFNRAPSRATIRRPNPPAAMLSSAPGVAGRTVRVSGLVNRSLRPTARPIVAPPQTEALVASVDTNAINAVIADSVNAALAEALAGAADTTTAAPDPTVTVAAAPAIDTGPEVVTRISTSGGRHWGINVGRYNSRFDAERVLLQVALNEMSSLDGALRRVVQRAGGFDANFMGLTRDGADLACRRLQARGTTCFMIGADG